MDESIGGLTITKGSLAASKLDPKDLIMEGLQQVYRAYRDFLVLQHLGHRKDSLFLGFLSVM